MPALDERRTGVPTLALSAAAVLLVAGPTDRSPVTVLGHAVPAEHRVADLTVQP